MIDFERIVLPNKLTVIVHTDTSSPLVAMNMLYKVGARDENQEKTGFAHLFEHLMFGGSVNIPRFDEPLERAGGENNAWTNNDVTNYYLTVPKNNIETAFWLESDRMYDLAFNEKSLEVQRNVVVEEFRQRYLNQPYGDTWLLLRPLAYTIHPYRWSTIGMEIDHIQNATMQDVKDFYERFYNPDNAILVLAGNINFDDAVSLCEKWFGPINGKTTYKEPYPAEPPQTEERRLTVERPVPFDAIYKAWHICKRTDEEIVAYDIISDVLSSGKSSRMYQKLVQEKRIFSNIDAYITADMDEGLFVVSGRIMKGVAPEIAEAAILEEIEEIRNIAVKDQELRKVINRAEAALRFSRTGIAEKAMQLALYEYMGDANLINTEFDRYKRITTIQVREAANKAFKPENCSSLIYKAR